MRCKLRRHIKPVLRLSLIHICQGLLQQHQLAGLDQPRLSACKRIHRLQGQLEAATDAKGRRIKVHKLPLPKPVTITAEECDGLDLCDGEPTRTPGERLAASYVNFYIANEAVVRCV